MIPQYTQYKSRVEKEPLENNFEAIESSIRELQDEINTKIKDTTSSELEDARGACDTLGELLRIIGTLVDDRVISGGIVSENDAPDMRVKISAGSALIHGVAVSWADSISASVPIPSVARRDAVVIGADGRLRITKGYDATEMPIPVIGKYDLLIAVIETNKNTETITDSNITSYVVDIGDVRLPYLRSFRKIGEVGLFKPRRGPSFGTNYEPDKTDSEIIYRELTPGYYTIGLVGSGAESENDLYDYILALCNKGNPFDRSSGWDNIVTTWFQGFSGYMTKY